MKSALVVFLTSISIYLLLAGCAMFSAKNIQETKNKIEVAIGQLGAGDFKLTGKLEKDGAAWGTVITTWTCRQGADGKLAGCTEPRMSFEPLK